MDDSQFLYLLLFFAALGLLFLWNQLNEAKQEVQQKAREQYKTWTDDEVRRIREDERRLASERATADLSKWKIQTEKALRQDAVKKSQAVTVGKVTEHLAPYLPDFPYNPKDVRFLGSPIDLIVFDGLSEGDLQTVVFVEVKSGSSTLSTRERRVRDAVREKRVEWEEFRGPSTEDLADDPAPEPHISEVTAQTVEAMAQGNADAQTNLGLMYGDGRGVPQIDAEAVRSYRLAADQGNARAQSDLGGMYADGRGVPQDDAEAIRWYRLAADQGYAIAQSILGSMSAIGRGIPQDDAEAVRWYHLAADQGHATAQFFLGSMYENGRGIPRDDAEAARWYRLAADQGDATAQFGLGMAYLDARGVPQDHVQALLWLNLAAASDEIDAAIRDAIAEKMTADQIAEAQRLAREWKPTTER